MFSFIYGAIKYALDYSSIKEDADDINNVIDCIENACEESKHVPQNNEYFVGDGYYYTTGKITFIGTDHVLVDNHYVCDMVNVSIPDLKVGDKVQYLALPKSHKEEHKIRKIISLVDQTWDDAIIKYQTNVDQPQTLIKCIIGKVIKRNGRKVLLEPNNISIDLNKVQSEFIPIVGDWLQLESMVQMNETLTDLSDDIIKIIKIRPLRSKFDIETISSYDPDKQIGIIGNSVIFNKTVCDSGYVPCVGDKVISDSIESDQGLYTWRALTVVPIIQVPRDSALLPTMCTSPFSMTNLDELLKNKCGIIISDNVNVTIDIEENKKLTVTIQNVGDAPCVLLKSCFMTQRSQSQLDLIEPPTQEVVSVIKPSDTISYIFKCSAKFVGTSEELFIFNFHGFDIGRIFRITVNSKSTPSQACSKTDNTKHKKVMQIPDLNNPVETLYIPGIRPYKPPAFIKIRNTVFKIPKHYWDLVLQGINEGKTPIECEQDIADAIPCLSHKVCFKSYTQRFHALLYLEEIAQIITFQQYDMQSIVMRHSNEFLVMEVPGLAEKRPSLLVGDRAIVSFKWDMSQEKLKYEGFIHKVRCSSIYLKFNNKFHENYRNEDCQVTFKCSNSSIQRCHNAVNLAINRLGSNFLFPTHVIQKDPQLYLEETETINKATDVQLKHQRADSLSSESSCISTASSSNRSSSTAMKSGRTSVVDRLFNTKSLEARSNVRKHTVAAIESSLPLHNNFKRNGINKDNSISAESLKDCNTNAMELKPYISQLKKRKLLWFNKNLNYYQKEAVKNILKGYARPLPYIIFGPPGTGKTVTLCEAILQIYSMLPESRLLIATPSNGSADLIAERILESGVLKPGDMVRLVAHHYLGSNSISDNLLPYCATAELAAEGTTGKVKHNGVGPKMNCSMSMLGRHRITIGTCITLGILNNIGFPRGHFSHVLIDEVGQAIEPEVLIPLNFIHSDCGQVVLSGDPLQLGPVVQSRLAKCFGLDESFLSRLLCTFPYQKDPHGFETQYDPRLVTKLVMNYRSLPEILQLSSFLFYDSELQPQISAEQSKEAMLLQTLALELPEREGSPPAIIFHGVDGENCKDTDSPSWYNPEEATQVYLYLLKLYKCGLSASDIGIITPYQKQVQQIRDLLLELDVNLPKISSVEGFQGQERNVIIISAVRSSKNHVNEDIKHSLGFVACPRRLNVAITRARALLIILGNPKLLLQDPYWRSVLQYCNNRGAYIGCTYISSIMESPQIKTNHTCFTNKMNDLSVGN